jgi:putative flippase GtrA
VPLKIAGAYPSSQGGIRQKIIGLDKKYGVFKAAKFGIASVTGFLVAEAILTLGALGFYGKVGVPSAAYSSPAYLALDIGALAFGVFIAFLTNERFTVHLQPTRKQGGPGSRTFRLLKFEGVNAMGSAVAIVTQFALLVTLSIAPVVGNIAGSIIAFPVTYVISMQFVWKTTENGVMEKSLTHHLTQPQKNGGPLSPPVTAMVFLVSLYVVGRILRRRKR